MKGLVLQYKWNKTGKIYTEDSLTICIKVFKMDILHV